QYGIVEAIQAQAQSHEQPRKGGRRRNKSRGGQGGQHAQGQGQPRQGQQRQGGQHQARHGQPRNGQQHPNRDRPRQDQRRNNNQRPRIEGNDDNRGNNAAYET